MRLLSYLILKLSRRVRIPWCYKAGDIKFVFDSVVGEGAIRHIKESKSGGGCDGAFLSARYRAPCPPLQTLYCFSDFDLNCA